MIFLVISTPQLAKPSTVVEQRKKYWPWAQSKLEIGSAKCFYARTGRGAVAIFDVESNEILHEYLNEWSEIVPAEFDIYPLIDPQQIQKFLSK